MADISENIDIFTDLSPVVYENKDAKLVLDSLRHAIISARNESKLKDVFLHKLVTSERTETTLTIEWIFNKFRVFLSFDKGDDPYYGLIYVDTELMEFTDTVQKIDMNHCNDAADTVLNFVLSKLKP